MNLPKVSLYATYFVYVTASQLSRYHKFKDAKIRHSFLGLILTSHHCHPRGALEGSFVTHYIILSLGSPSSLGPTISRAQWVPSPGAPHPRNLLAEWCFEELGWGTNCASCMCIMYVQGYICVCKCDVWCVGSRILILALQIYCCEWIPR